MKCNLPGAGYFQTCHPSETWRHHERFLMLVPFLETRKWRCRAIRWLAKGLCWLRTQCLLGLQSPPLAIAAHVLQPLTCHVQEALSDLPPGEINLPVMTPSCPMCSTVLPSTNQCCDDVFTCADVWLRAVSLPLGSKHRGARAPIWFCSLLNPQWQSCAWHSVGAQQTLVQWMNEHAHYPHKKINSSTFAFCRGRSWAAPAAPLTTPPPRATALISIPSRPGSALARISFRDIWKEQDFLKTKLWQDCWKSKTTRHRECQTFPLVLTYSVKNNLSNFQETVFLEKKISH